VGLTKDKGEKMPIKKKNLFGKGSISKGPVSRFGQGGENRLGEKERSAKMMGGLNFTKKGKGM